MSERERERNNPRGYGSGHSASPRHVASVLTRNIRELQGTPVVEALSRWLHSEDRDADCAKPLRETEHTQAHRPSEHTQYSTKYCTTSRILYREGSWSP